MHKFSISSAGFIELFFFLPGDLMHSQSALYVYKFIIQMRFKQVVDGVHFVLSVTGQNTY